MFSVNFVICFRTAFLQNISIGMVLSVGSIFKMQESKKIEAVLDLHRIAIEKIDRNSLKDSFRRVHFNEVRVCSCEDPQKKRPFNSCFPMNDLKVLRTYFYKLLINLLKQRPFTVARKKNCFERFHEILMNPTSIRQNYGKLCEVFQSSFFEEQLLVPKIVFKNQFKIHSYFEMVQIDCKVLHLWQKVALLLGSA